MAGAVIGGLLGMAFGESLVTWGLLQEGMAGLGWLWGASVGSLFDQPSVDFGTSSPNYSFAEIYNTKSQLLPVQVPYGRVRMAGNIFMQQYYDDNRQKMDMFVGLGRGPINRVISVYANEYVLYGDGSDTQSYWTLVGGEWQEVTYAEYVAFEGTKEIRDEDGNPVTVDLQECSCDIHLGEATQAKDSREPADSTYPGVAYLGLTLKVQDGLTGNPTITTELEGRKIWTPSGTRYTNNPVWCIWDLLTNAEFGVGVPADSMNLEAAEAAAAYCDTLVDGKPRYTLGYIIDQQRPVPDILRDMCMCFDGYFREREKIEICVNQPVAAPSKAIDVATSAVRETFSWWQKSREETYNRIVLEWVDPDNHYERTSSPFEAETDILERGIYERNLSLLGVTDATQAARLGEQALNYAQKIHNFCSFDVSVKDFDIEVGDVVSITESAVAGWTNKWFHVLDIQENAEREEATITFVEYAADAYVDTPTLPIVTPDNPEPTPEADNYSNLLLTDIGTQQEDGTYVPRIRVRFTPPSGSMKEHVVNWWHDEESVLEKKVSPAVTDVLISEGIRTGVALTVRVWGTDVNGKKRTGVIGQIVPGKDDVAPGAPTNLTAMGWFGDVILNWVNPTRNVDGSPCTDLAYIEIWENDEDVRDGAIEVGEINGTTFTRHLGSFQGRWYWIRAVDTSGNVSAWNAEMGVYGDSSQESHQDIVDWLLENSEYLREIQEDLNTPIESILDSSIFDNLGEYREAQYALLQQRAQEKAIEAAIQSELGGYSDFKWTLATINEEKIARETDDEALASWIRSVSAMIGDPLNPAEDTVYATVREEMTARTKADEALAKNITTLEAIIGDPWHPTDGTVYAAIRAEETARAAKDEALAKSINTLSAIIGDPVTPTAGTIYGIIRDERTVRAAADEALATSVTQLAAGIGNPDTPGPGTVYAAIKAEQSARAGGDAAVAASVTTLQTSVNGNTNSVGVLLQSIDGIKGKIALTIDSNGLLTGWELIGGDREGSMIFHVDNLMIGRPGATSQYPFVIGVVDGQQRISMSNAFIQDGAIKDAKIADLTIGHVKLASGAACALSWGDGNYYNWDDFIVGNMGYLTTTPTIPSGGDVTINVTGASRVLLWGVCRGIISGNQIWSGIYKGGTLLQSMGGVGSESTMSGLAIDKTPGSGYKTYNVKAWLTAGAGKVLTSCGITAVAFYR